MPHKPWRVDCFRGLSVYFDGRRVLEHPNREGALLVRLAYDWFRSPDTLQPLLGSRTRAWEDYFYGARQGGRSQMDNLVWLLKDRLRSELGLRRKEDDPTPILQFGEDAVGLNPETVSCDLLEFRQALERVQAGPPNLPHMAHAVALYGDFAPNLSPKIRQSPWFLDARETLKAAGEKVSQELRRAVYPYIANGSSEVWLLLKLEETFDQATTQMIVERLRQRFPDLPPPPGARKEGMLRARFPVLPFHRNALFVERTTPEGPLFSLMNTRLRGADAHPGWLALTGVRGIGKTQQALEYAYRVASSFTHVWWVRGDSVQTFIADLRAVAGELGLAQKEDAVTFDALARFFRQSSGWLLVLDNLRVPEVVGRWLAPWQRGAVLVTTYRSDTHPFVSLEVPLMTDDEGARLLLTRAGLLAEDQALAAVAPAAKDDAVAVVRLLGGLPLAINQAAAYLRSRHLPLARFPDLYRAKGEELRAAHEGFDVSEHPSVFVTFSLLLDELRGTPKGQAPDATGALAADILYAAAFLAPDRIPLYLFAQGATALGERIATASPAECEEAVGRLETYALLKCEGETVSIHAVVQDVIRDVLHADGRQLWLARVAAALRMSAPEGYEFTTWLDWEERLPHVLRVSELSEAIPCATRELGLLCTTAATYLRDRGRSELSEPLFVRALAVWDALPGNAYQERVNTSIAYSGLLRDTDRRPEAIRRLQEVRALVLDRAPDDRVCHARLANNVGLYLLEEDQEAVGSSLATLQEARSFLEEAVSLRTAEFGQTDRQTLWSSHNLALCLDRLGRYEEALRLHMDVLTRRQTRMTTNLGKPIAPTTGTHPDIGYSYAALGRHCRATGRTHEARRWFEQALTVWAEEGSLECDHVDVQKVQEDLHTLGDA